MKHYVGTEKIFCDECWSQKQYCEECSKENMRMNPDYKKGFKILMEYFDSIPDVEQLEVDKRLTECGL